MKQRLKFQRRKIQPKNIHSKIKKFICTSLSEQSPLGFLTRVTGKRAKVRANFVEKVRVFFGILVFWVGFCVSEIEAC